MAEAKFTPKPDQVDYTNIRYAPTINCVITDGKQVLLLQRGSEMRLYPDYWNGASGFLDDAQDLEDKVREELREELGFGPQDIVEITRGRVVLQEAPEYNKTWLVVAVLVTVKTRDFVLDWETKKAEWMLPEEVYSRQLLPGFAEVFEQFFPRANK